MSNTRFCLLFVIGALLASIAASAGDSPSTGIDLSGTWVLNTKLSDDPREVMQEKMEKMRASGGGGGMPGGPPGGGMPGGPPAGGMPGGGGRMPMGEGDEGGEAVKERAKEFKPARRIVITQRDQEITMAPEGRDTLTVIPDGTKREKKTPMGTVTMEARWDEVTLEVRTKGAEGREAKRLYRINAEGRLEIVTEMSMPRGDEKVQIVLRYDEEVKDEPR